MRRLERASLCGDRPAAHARHFQCRPVRGQLNRALCILGIFVRSILPFAALFLVGCDPVLGESKLELPQGFVADPLGQAIQNAFAEPSAACPAGHFNPPGQTHCKLCRGYVYEQGRAQLQQSPVCPAGQWLKDQCANGDTKVSQKCRPSFNSAQKGALHMPVRAGPTET
jgi:hypothetical protein